MTKKEEWIRVRSEGEIGVGMALKVIRCETHERDCHLSILARVQLAPLHVRPDGTMKPHDVGTSAGFKTTHEHPAYSGTCFCGSIPEGRLFRLELGDEKEEEQIEKQPRQMERTE